MVRHQLFGFSAFLRANPNLFRMLTLDTCGFLLAILPFRPTSLSLFLIVVSDGCTSLSERGRIAFNRTGDKNRSFFTAATMNRSMRGVVIRGRPLVSTRGFSFFCIFDSVLNSPARNVEIGAYFVHGHSTFEHFKHTLPLTIICVLCSAHLEGRRQNICSDFMKNKRRQCFIYKNLKKTLKKR